MEVLVACALVSLVLAAAGPSISAMRNSFELQNATFQVANDLRLARERAIATNGKGRMVFAVTEYQLKRESPVGSGTYVNDGAVFELPTGVTAASNPANPTFDSRGLTAQAYTITLTNSAGTAKTISVTVIGRISVD
jgi:Tfp pilus assembly protein FimT